MALLAAACSMAVLADEPHATAGACAARSAERPLQLVELYTSEGCNACPPADRWLSSLRGRAGVVAVAFHVDYWDQLGWPDRFASAANTTRQRAQAQRAGAGFVYTPQVLVDGRDWRRWPALPTARDTAATVALTLSRSGPEAVQATLTPLAGAPRHITLWWAWLEDGHVTAVRSGENHGVTLRHDQVVRRWQDLGIIGERRQWTLAAPRAGEAGRHARVLLAAADADTGATLQALVLDC